MPASDLAAITPLVLTYNEAPNIGRTLEALSWAERVVVLDSGSVDSTKDIARSFSNVAWYKRPFDCHRAQWEYGIHNTDIRGGIILALDADMIVTPKFIEELREKFITGQYEGGVIPFEYRVLGTPLSGSICPPQLRIFTQDKVNVSQPGHTQEFTIVGRLYRFQSALIHDDRKGIERWVNSQLSYSALEAKRLLEEQPIRRWRDWLRKSGLMPPIAAGIAYLRAGGPFRGSAALRYAYERAIYESLLASRLLAVRLEKKQVKDVMKVRLDVKNTLDRTSDTNHLQ